jgi:hypothetical protein
MEPIAALVGCVLKNHTGLSLSIKDLKLVGGGVGRVTLSDGELQHVSTSVVYIPYQCVRR